MQKLINKVAFVTGGSRGIGAAIVTRLAQEGAMVLFSYVNAEDQAGSLVKRLTADGLKATAIWADGAVDGAITAAIEQLLKSYGRIDILVNNAGIYIGKEFEQHTMEDYDRIMAVNVRPVMEACLIAARKMENSGRIIMIGSNMADHVSSSRGTLYAMSKSALTAFTKGLARDLGHRSITVNIVQPGPVNTEMNPENNPRAECRKALMAIPQYGKPEHIAGLVAYLADPRSEFTTGSVFTIDGGFNC